MKIELRKWITRGVFFSHECENNTIKKTVEEAVKQGVSLAWADLPEANLAGADLPEADLAWANLFRAKLAGANLAGAKLAGADLYMAKLPEANLAGANLAGANLYMANLAGSKCDESQKDNILKAIGLVFHERKEEK